MKKRKSIGSEVRRVAKSENWTGELCCSGQFSLYAYPWDVLDEGTDSFAQICERAGLTSVSLAASYHGGKALLPHNSRQRVYFIEDGAVYFPPSRRIFQGVRLQPRVSRLAGKGDIFRQIVEACGRKGISTAAWTVALHNRYLGQAYPDVTTQNVFGDRYTHALCPSHPDVRAYMRALAANLSLYPIGAVKLEAFEFIAFRHYGFLEKEGISVTPMANLLLSLCFCPACLRAAERSRIRVGFFAKAVRTWLEQYFRGENRSEASVGSRLSSVPVLDEYLRFRTGILNEAFMEVADAFHAERKKVIPIIIDQNHRVDPLSGVDLQSFSENGDAIESLFYNRRPEEARSVLRAIRKACGKDIPVHLAIRPGYPDARKPDDTVRMTESILSSGGHGVSFYNFGLFEKSHLQWIRTAIYHTNHRRRIAAAKEDSRSKALGSR